MRQKKSAGNGKLPADEAASNGDFPSPFEFMIERFSKSYLR